MSEENPNAEPVGSSDGAASGSVDLAARNRELQTQLDDAVSRRKNASAKADEYKARAETLEKDLTTQRESYEGKLLGVTGELAEAKGIMTKRDFAVAVLAGIPHENHNQAGLLLDGLIAREGIDPTSVDNMQDLAADVSKRLQSAAPQLFAQATDTATGGGIQAPPNPSDWDRYTSLSQIPKEQWGKIPPAVYLKLKQGSGGGQPAL